MLRPDWLKFKTNLKLACRRNMVSECGSRYSFVGGLEWPPYPLFTL